MATRKRYRFHFNAYTPETIPMSRLAEYLEHLAGLFGSESEVHFAGLEGGSTAPLVEVEWEAIPKVRERLQIAPTPDAPPDVAKSYRSLDKLLERDNASADLTEEPEDDEPRKVVAFPGVRKPRTLEYGPFQQDGTIDGVLIRIGGMEDMVPVHLREGQVVHVCQANHNKARELAPHLFGGPLRAIGNGTWFRDHDGNWEMRRFTIEGFKTLGRDDLRTTVERLRTLDQTIKNIEDPLGELEKIRRG